MTDWEELVSATGKMYDITEPAPHVKRAPRRISDYRRTLGEATTHRSAHWHYERGITHRPATAPSGAMGDRCEREAERKRKG